MPWVVGIDEAGYGPNLGPLVQAAVGLYLPDGDPAGWDTLKSVVRRAHERADGRLLIDDSKKVYARGGLAALERGVHRTLGCSEKKALGHFLYSVSRLKWIEALVEEVWFDTAELVPLADPDRVDFHRCAEGCGGHIGFVGAILTPAGQFNQIIDGANSKAAILATGLSELLAETLVALPTDNKPVQFLCDKHGGRNFYGEMIREAFPDGWVVIELEGAAESHYRVELLDRPVAVVFRPRADGDSVAVALASMLCKYLREVCMLQFNRYWATHVPGIKPTAGYPTDAKRFYAEIRGAMAKLGLGDDQVWRKR